MSDSIQLEASWKKHLAGEFQKSYMQNLKLFLMEEKKKNKRIYPKGSEYFSALDLTPFDQVKVVILGQDPYHGPQQAHGLCFSVLPKVKVPPSLENIYKELYQDLKVPIASQGFLKEWAKQGVLLLNNTLTVEAGKAGSHKGRGWEEFTDKIIYLLNKEREHLVFLLWGKFAGEKGAIVDTNKHCVLKAPHPSPFSADRGFFGCRHFSKTNSYLKSKGIKEIDWSAHLH
ncbi:MAG: uracil-DNA glycosylase [Bdellovibrionaceae bacterium]|nr:uracil-DNA glycosylase [Pseudobdellovibrionaceae bacterium]